MTRRLILFIFCYVLAFEAVPYLFGQQVDRGSIEQYSREAERALARNDTEAARGALEELSRLTPNDAEVYANLGAVDYTEGRYPQAVEAYQTALRLNPEIQQVPLMLGMCYMELGKVADAVPMLESGFQHPPNDEVGRSVGLNLLSAYISLNQEARAVGFTTILLERYPNDPEVLYQVSHVYGDMALNTMTHLADVAPDSIWKQLSFAEALESEKRYDAAIILYRKVLSKAPDMALAHYRLGRALLLKDPDNPEAREEALKEFRSAVAADPRNSAAEYEIGELYRRQGQFDLARDHFTRALEIDPREEEAQIALSRTLLRLHEPKTAVLHLLAAIRLNPNNEVSHFLLASAYKALGDSASSHREMEIYRQCHARTNTGEARNEDQAPQLLSTPTVTKQTMETEAPVGPK